MKLHPYYKYFTNILQSDSFSSCLIIFLTIDFSCNLTFSHHLKFMMPSWKKENMQLKNGKVKTELILIVTYDISCNGARFLKKCMLPTLYTGRQSRGICEVFYTVQI